MNPAKYCLKQASIILMSSIFKLQLWNNPKQSDAEQQFVHDWAISGKALRTKAFIKAGGQINFKDELGRTPLFYGCFYGHYELVTTLVEGHAKVDIQDLDHWTPLQVSADNGYVKIVRYLLNHGADASITDKNRRTALHVAVKNKRHQVIKELVRSKADVNLTDYRGRTALHIAVINQDSIAVNEILLVSPQLNIGDEAGNTPLHIAIKLNNREIAIKLIEAGADRSVLNNAGRTPMGFSANKILDKAPKLSRRKKPNHSKKLHRTNSLPILTEYKRIQEAPFWKKIADFAAQEEFVIDHKKLF